MYYLSIFLGLGLRNTLRALEPFQDNKKSYVSIWKWLQRLVFNLTFKKEKEYIHL